MLLYDRESESFWSQVDGRCVVGPSQGAALAWLPTEVTTWAAWKAAHPKTTALAPVRKVNEYRLSLMGVEDYHERGQPMRKFLPASARIRGTFLEFDHCTIVQEGKSVRCYPHPSLKEGETTDGEWTITRRGNRVVVRDRGGRVVPSLQAFWFAFCAYFPDGEIWTPPQSSKETTR